MNVYLNVIKEAIKQAFLDGQLAVGAGNEREAEAYAIDVAHGMPINNDGYDCKCAVPKVEIGKENCQRCNKSIY